MLAKSGQKIALKTAAFVKNSSAVVESVLTKTKKAAISPIQYASSLKKDLNENLRGLISGIIKALKTAIPKEQVTIDTLKNNQLPMPIAGDRNTDPLGPPIPKITSGDQGTDPALHPPSSVPDPRPDIGQLDDEPKNEPKNERRADRRDLAGPAAERPRRPDMGEHDPRRTDPGHGGTRKGRRTPGPHRRIPHRGADLELLTAPHAHSQVMPRLPAAPHETREETPTP